MVVWASHCSSSCTRLRFSATNFRRSNSGFDDVARLRGEALRAARRGEADQRVDERRADALPAGGRIDVEHVELVGALEAGEGDDEAFERRDDGELAGESGAEGVLVVGARRPGGALVVVVVVGGRDLDGVAERSRRSARRRPADRGGRRRRSSLELPGRSVLAVLNDDAELRQVVAQSVGFSPILFRSGFVAFLDQLDNVSCYRR